MKAAKSVFLISAICLIDPASSKGQLLNGKQLGAEEDHATEKFEEHNNLKDNLGSIES